jgi:hypothetical protein
VYNASGWGGTLNRFVCETYTMTAGKGTAFVADSNSNNYNYRLALTIPTNAITLYYNRPSEPLYDKTIQEITDISQLTEISQSTNYEYKSIYNTGMFDYEGYDLPFKLNINTNVTINARLPKTVTKIAKDGMIVSNGNKILGIDEDSITMVVKRLDVKNDTAAFGIRVTNNGIFIADGEPIGENRGSIWNKIDASKLIRLSQISYDKLNELLS